MGLPTPPAASTTAKKGVYVPSRSTDSRSPCPALNVLANHGFLPRDGRNIAAADLHAALSELGVGSILGAVFAYPPYNELPAGHGGQAEAQPAQPAQPSWLWRLATNPFMYALSSFAMRNPGQKNVKGVACLDLDQFSRHNVVEHDVSLSRFDHAQGDNHSPQPELIRDILAASSDDKTLTIADFIKLRKARMERQKSENPGLKFGAFQQQIACSEVALILKVFGDGSSVPLSYVKAFFEEERLPREEGWTKRAWIPLGLVELNLLVGKLIVLMGRY